MQKNSHRSKFTAQALSTLLALALVILYANCGGAFAAQAQTANEAAAPAKTTDGAAQKESVAAQNANPQDAETRRLPAVDKYRLDLGFKSLYFTAVPLAAAVLLVILALWSGQSDIKDRLLPFFGDGQFGQYIVVILVAGNVCTLALVGLLNSSEIGTIYGGIIGYVLGKRSSGGDSGAARENKSAAPPQAK